MAKSQQVEIIERVVAALRAKTSMGGYVGGNTVGWVVQELESLLPAKKIAIVKKKKPAPKVKKLAKKPSKKK